MQNLNDISHKVMFCIEKATKNNNIKKHEEIVTNDHR